jgi:osmotically inducible protein OsmC
MATRNGSAEWRGNLKDGDGDLTVGDGVFKGSYSFSSRFEEGEGTNPEELIAAAHAACFSMAFSNGLGKQGTPPERLSVSAAVTFVPGTGITTSAIDVEGDVPGIDEATFQKAAEEAKEGCPVSMALRGNVELSVTARLAGS